MFCIDESITEIAGHVPMQHIPWSVMDEHGVELWLRRDDLLPTWCQGNKYYKLYHNLKRIRAGQVVVSFGGPFSNHLHALALAAKNYGMPCIGIVRGERPVKLSPTLVDVEAAGMRLIFVSRSYYRELTSESCTQTLQDVIAVLIGADPASFQVVPEGGANDLGVLGCVELGRDIARRSMALFGAGQPFNDVLVAVGTGTTLAGLAIGLPGNWCVSGVSVLGESLKAGQVSLSDAIAKKVGKSRAANWRLIEGYGLGGYGRSTPELVAFMDNFLEHTGIVLDQVYTGKLFWAIAQQVQHGYWNRGSRLLAIHTGGLQGRRGLGWN